MINFTEDLLFGYLGVMNVLGILVMKIDKEKAKQGGYRIPEKTLFTVSILGGSLGTWLGMYLFRHKTKHWYFKIGMPLIFFAHLAIYIYYISPLFN